MGILWVFFSKKKISFYLYGAFLNGKLSIKKKKVFQNLDTLQPLQQPLPSNRDKGHSCEVKLA